MSIFYPWYNNNNILDQSIDDKDIFWQNNKRITFLFLSYSLRAFLSQSIDDKGIF